jgi:hypothetical protein
MRWKKKVKKIKPIPPKPTEPNIGDKKTKYEIHYEFKEIKTKQQLPNGYYMGVPYFNTPLGEKKYEVRTKLSWVETKTQLKNEEK